MLFHNLSLESKVQFLYHAHHSFMGGVALGVTRGRSQTRIPNCLTSIICFSFCSSFFPAVHLLRLQEELLLLVLHTAGESAHLYHMSLAKGDGVSAAAAHAPTSQGPASVLAAP